MKSMTLIQTTAIPSSFGMSTRGRLGHFGALVLDAPAFGGVVANEATRGYADRGSDHAWSPSLC